MEVLDERCEILREDARPRRMVERSVSLNEYLKPEQSAEGSDENQNDCHGSDAADHPPHPIVSRAVIGRPQLVH